MPHRIAIVADTHFGRKHRLQPKLNERALEALRQVLSHDFDALVIAGDVFHTGTPHPTLIAEVMRALREGLRGRMCLMLYGNHDVTRIGSAVDPLREMNSDNIIIPNPMLHGRLAGYSFYAESWPVGARPGTLIKRELQDVDLAIVHGSLKDHPNSPRGDWQYDISGARLVVAGHLHAPSLHPAGNYPGSLVPGSFAESHKPGFLMYEAGELTRVELDIPVRFTNLTASQARGYEPMEGEAIRVTTSEPEAALTLQRHLESLGATAEVTYAPKATQVRAEAASVSEKTTMRDAYESYLKGVGGDVTLVEDAKEFFHDFNVE